MGKETKKVLANSASSPVVGEAAMEYAPAPPKTEKPEKRSRRPRKAKQTTSESAWGVKAPEKPAPKRWPQWNQFQKAMNEKEMVSTPEETLWVPPPRQHTPLPDIVPTEFGRYRYKVMSPIKVNPWDHEVLPAVKKALAEKEERLNPTRMPADRNPVLDFIAQDAEERIAEYLEEKALMTPPPQAARDLEDIDPIEFGRFRYKVMSPIKVNPWDHEVLPAVKKALAEKEERLHPTKMPADRNPILDIIAMDTQARMAEYNMENRIAETEARIADTHARIAQYHATSEACLAQYQTEKGMANDPEERSPVFPAIGMAGQLTTSSARPSQNIYQEKMPAEGGIYEPMGHMTTELTKHEMSSGPVPAPPRGKKPANARKNPRKTNKLLANRGYF